MLQDQISRDAAFADADETGVEIQHGLSEIVFGAVAPDMVRLGWSVFPQETGGSRRLPGTINGRMIKWRGGQDPAKTGDQDLAKARMGGSLLRDCVQQCASLNVAAIFGEASGHTFAIDVDCMDAEKVKVIISIAEEILGPTPFMRIGRAPKIALIYRHGPLEADRVHSTSRFFAATDANGDVSKSEDGLEILGATKTLTFHGRHHSTGKYFSWVGDATPLLDGPELAPLVTPEQVIAFLEAVDSHYRFHRGAAFSASAANMKWDNGVLSKIPKIMLAAGGTPFPEDSEGYVVNGREAYLAALVFQTASSVKSDIEAAMSSSTRDALKTMKERVAVAVVDAFMRTARMDGRWSEAFLRREALSKTSHLIEKVARGENILRRAMDYRGPTAPSLVLPAKATAGADPELSFIRENRVVSSARGGIRGTVEAPPSGAPSLEIPADRTPIAEMVKDGLKNAFAAFFTDVYGDPIGIDEKLQKTCLHILKAPPGAGKTSRCIQMIAQDYRTKEDFSWIDPKTKMRKSGRAPWIMLLPTYANIDELKTRAAFLNLDGTLSDEALAAQALEAGLVPEEDLADRLVDLRREARNCGLITEVYSGKLKAGCKVASKLQLAMAAGIGTAAFCKAKVRKKAANAKRDDPGEFVEEVCPHYEGCPAIQQRTTIQSAHLVFMPHSFLALAIPDELQEVRGVIADERIHHLFLHTTTFAATSLAIPRKPPRLTAAEKADDVLPEDLLAERDHAAHIALEALRGSAAGGTRCPAQALYEYRRPGVPDDGKLPGLGLVRSALKVCSSGIQRDANLSPLTSFEDVEAMCARPTGRDLREEKTFWEIVEDRIVNLQIDALKISAIDKAIAERDMLLEAGNLERAEEKERQIEKMQSITLKAPGTHDYRIQFLTESAVNGGEKELVRISWRTVPNWAAVPVLLLDASAAPAIIAKIWRRHETDIVMHDVVEDGGSILNVKIVGVVNQTFSNSSIAASADADELARIAAGKLLAKVRMAISTVSALYGHGRVVAGTSIVLRELINNGWVCPDNVDWCHFGAMRGLDGFKNHAAAISIGRMEPPTRTIDGLAAALTYDDPVPENPFDLRGDGLNEDLKSIRLPFRDQRSRLRSGYIATLQVPMFEGRWARLIQSQYREEEALQFVGRLRPVYREGPSPVWFNLSSVIPEELVVDDMIDIEDLVSVNGALWNAVRRTGGVVEPTVLHKTCPEIYRTVKAAREAMKKAGFQTGEIQPICREVRGFSVYLWNDRKGAERMVFIRTSVPDHQSLLMKALAGRIGAEPPTLVWSPDLGISARARPRAADTVEKRIGDMNLRSKLEHQTMDLAGVDLLKSPGLVTESINGINYPMGSMGGYTVLADDAYAKVSVERFWAARRGAADDRLMPHLKVDDDINEQKAEASEYDYLGSSVVDQDLWAA